MSMYTEFGPDRLRFTGLIPEKNYNIGFQPTVRITSVRVRDLLCGSYVRVLWFPCVTYVNFYGLARVAIQGLTWVNF